MINRMDTIEVFRDLTMRGPLAQRPQLREALIAKTTPPWSFDPKRSEEVVKYSITKDDVLMFRREKDDRLPSSGLTLWSTNDGYYVPNIVPTESGRLTFEQYNAVLEDFIARVAEPSATHFGFSIETTKPHQTLEDWLTTDAASKLRSFSGLANKSTGTGHPNDERRWFDFVVAAHRGNRELDANRLARWLHEAEGWSDESAHDLAGNFENCLALLTFYDRN